MSTFWFNKNAPGIPVVLFHCILSGTGQFYQMVDHINRPIFSIDLPGYGDSDRVKFSKDPEPEWLLALQGRVKKKFDEKKSIFHQKLFSRRLGDFCRNFSRKIIWNLEFILTLKDLEI